MQKRQKEVMEPVSPEVMEKYQKIRRNTFNLCVFPMALVYLLLPDGIFRNLLTSILLIPSLVLAIMATKMYSKFPTRTKKAIGFHWFGLNLIDFHPYAAVGFILLMQIIFLSLGLCELLK